jgi:hypothetical protein
MVAHREIAAIPHLHTLAHRIRCVSKKDPDAFFATEGALEQLPHSLAGAAYAMLALARAQNRALARLKKENLTGSTFTDYGLGEDEQDPMVFAVDGFLESARRAQNAVWVYLSKVLKTSLPQSLADIANKLEQGKKILPDRLADIIKGY